MDLDKVCVQIVEAVQVAGATSCRATFTAGGTIRLYVEGPVYGLARYKLEEKIRWMLPERYDVMVFQEAQS